MNLYHLKYFFDSVQAGSLRQAAEINHVTPGAVSQAILRLEQHFNVALVHHRKNNFELTDSGKKLFSLCPQMLSAMHNLKTGMEDSKDAFRGKIHFATQQSIASIVLAPILADFAKKYPLVKTSFRLGRTINVKNLLDQRSIEFGITMDNIDYGDHSKIPLFNGEFVFIAAKRLHRGEHEFLLTESTSEVDELTKAYRQKHDRDIPVSMRVHSWSVIKQLALEGYGIGFVPDYVVGKEDRKFLVKNLAFPSFKYTVSCIYPKGHSLSLKSKALLDHIRASTNGRP